VNTHIQNLKVWLISVLSWLIYSIFSRGLFFYWRTLYVVFERNASRRAGPSVAAMVVSYISHLGYDVSVRLFVCLSVTEVHWHIIANLGFKFRSHFTAHCGRRASSTEAMRPCCSPCCLRADRLAPC